MGNESTMELLSACTVFGYQETIGHGFRPRTCWILWARRTARFAPTTARRILPEVRPSIAARRSILPELRVRFHRSRLERASIGSPARKHLRP